MIDPIVDEVRRVRDEHAARFGYDLDAIFEDIKDQEKKSGQTFVSFTPNWSAPDQARSNDAALPANRENQPSHSAPTIEP